MSVNTDEPIGFETVTVTYTEWGEYQYFASFTVSFGYRGKPLTAAGDAGLTLMRLWADGELIYDRVAQLLKPGVNWYQRDGHEDQDPVPGYDLAYRGQILLTFDDYPLGPSPSGLPTISGEFFDAETYTVGDALETFAIRAGFQEPDIVTINLDQPLIGYLIDGNSTLESVSSDLSALYDFTMVEVAGVITFAHKYVAGDFVIDETIPDGRLAVLREGSTEQQIDILERVPEQGLPYKITAQYFDFDANYEKGSQTAQRSSGPVLTHTSQVDATFSLPIVAEGAEIRGLLFDALFRAWAERNGHSIRLPPEFLALDPGDSILWSAYGGTYSGVAIKATINADFSTSISIAEKSASYAPVTVATQGPATPVPVIGWEASRAFVFDVPNTDPEQDVDDYLQFRVAMGGATPGSFNGGRLDMSNIEQPGSWLPRVVFEDEIGIAVLTETPAPDATSILIDLDSMTVAELTTRAGENMIVGKDTGCEILTYTTVVDNMDGTATLSGLDRGLFSTDDFINQHVLGDPVVFYDDCAVVTYPVTEFEARTTYLYRAVSAFMPIYEADVLAWLPRGGSRKPYAPENVACERQVNGDIEITWTEQVRFLGEPDPLIFVVEIFDADWIMKRRIAAVYEQTSVLYFIEEQLIDDLNTVDDLNVLVYQQNISHSVRGFPGGGVINITDEAVIELAGTIDANPTLTGELFDGTLAGVIDANPTLVGAIELPPLVGIIDANPTLTGNIAGIFSGALVTLSAPIVGINASADFVIITGWDTETYDVGGWHDNGTNPSRLTVPAGTSKIRATAQLAASSVSADVVIQVGIFKNGSIVYSGSVTASTTGGVTNPALWAATPILAVTPGDYFEFAIFSGDSSITVDAVSSFSIEKVE